MTTVTQKSTEINSIIKNLEELTEVDAFIWTHESDNTDCKYAAEFKGQRLLLDCCKSQNPCLIINGVAYKQTAVNSLCRRVGNQLIRLKIKENNKGLEELVKGLTELRDTVEPVLDVANLKFIQLPDK